MKDLVQDIKEFMDDGALPLVIPKEIREINSKTTRNTSLSLQNIKEKYDSYRWL